MSDSPAPLDQRFYGRRKGKKLKSGQQSLMETLYPRLSLPQIAKDGEDPEEFEKVAPHPIDPRQLFPDMSSGKSPLRALWLEIGFGGGEHLAHQARNNPDVGFIGAEPFVNGIGKLLSQVNDEGLNNIRIYGNDVRPFLDCLPDGCFDKIFLLYPDPWPKKRHWQRRFVNTWMLDVVARLLVDGGEFRVASDDPTYQSWTLRLVPEHPSFRWTAQRPSDWQTRWPDACSTRYEQKALRCGRTPMYFTFLRQPRPC